MYVCLCNRVTDSAIQDSVRKGASCLGDVQRQLGVASQCGRCLAMAEEIIQDTQNQDGNFLPYAVA